MHQSYCPVLSYSLQSALQFLNTSIRQKKKKENKRPATPIKEIKTDSENELYGNIWVSKLVLKG